MTDTRQNRETQTREVFQRQAQWAPASLLPEIKKTPGWAYRWVRTSMAGQADATNVSSKMREGWEPVKAADHPEITMVTIENDRFADNVVIGGLMLCKAPTELVEERTEYYDTQTKSQMHSVDNNFMRENDPRMPLFNERKTKVTFGNGTFVAIGSYGSGQVLISTDGAN